MRILPALLQKQQHHARGVRRAGRSKSKTRLNVEALDPRVLLSGMGHDHDHSMHPEHMAALNLVPRDQASHVATSGNWSEIWGQGLPATGAEVLIPHGVTVTVDGQFTQSIDWIRVDGTLRFATDQDTALRVDTIVVDPSGRLQIGTEAQPIAPEYRAQVTFVDQGPIDRMADPLGVGRGLIDLSGHLSIYGAETTNFVDLAQYPRKGDTVLQLTSLPTNWEVGGQVVVAGTNRIDRPQNFVIQDEVRTIVAIQGNQVTVNRSLEYDHALPGGVPLPVAYLDRNVVLTSENAADPSRRGHIMVMPGGHDHVHLPDDPMGSVVAYARFDGLGRTRADIAVTDPQLDEHGHLIIETTGNDRGRYSLHFHHMGIDNPSRPSTVRGVSVTHGLKWGVVNHESNIVVEDSLTYDVHGAGFVTEFGNEIGVFRNNIAILSVGDATYQRAAGQNSHDLDFRWKDPLPEGHDLGWQGYGFWLQGGGVKVIDNVAIGHKRDAFAIFTQPLKDGIEFPAKNLPDDVRDILIKTYDREGNLVEGERETIPIEQVPFTFTGNTGLASRIGLGIYFHFSHWTSDRYDVYSVVENSAFGNVDEGVRAYHGSNTIYRDVQMINDWRDHKGKTYGTGNAGWTRYGDSRDIIWDNVTIIGFGSGINVPPAGDSQINGGYFANYSNVVFPSNLSGHVSLILDDSNFGSPPNQLVYEHWNIVQQSLTASHSDPSPTFVTRPGRITLQRDGETYFLYHREADPKYRLDTADHRQARDIAAGLAHHFPKEFMGMTAGELWDAHGVAVGGAIAGSDAFSVPGIYGVLSKVAPPEPATIGLKLRSPQHTNQIKDYTLTMRDTSTGRWHNVATVDLKPNQWNFVAFEYGGHTYTQLIYADTTPPSDFRLTDSSYRTLNTPPTITQDQIKNGFTVYGLYTDTIGVTSQQFRFSTYVRPEDITVDSDGKVRLRLTVTDGAGNTRDFEFTYTVV